MAKPGDTVLAGIHMRMDPHWHTYWKNPGESGQATSIHWNLPRGITAGEIEWPLPSKMVTGPVITYGYDDEVVLLVPLKLDANLAPGSYDLKAKVNWLECEEVCLQGNGEVAATFQVGAETKPSANAGLINAWKEKLPKSGDGLSVHAQWEDRAKNNLRPMTLEWNSPSAVDEVDFFPIDTPQFAVHGETERLQAAAGKIQLRKQVKKFEGDWPKQISGLLVQKSGGDRTGYNVTLSIAPGSAKVAAAGGSSQPLWKMLLFGFVGGMIMNIMPCVFPVIALKILGFVQQSRQDPRQVFRHGLIYSLGVLASFLVLAAAMISIQHATGLASWGMQLQNRWFTLLLTVITLLVAMNLFGVFEVNLGSAVMSKAGELSAREGAAGTFFNGAFATMLATSCTAPILAQALGFAFTQPPALVLVMFSSVALGLAFPYLLLSWKPQWLKFLPRPGPWMEKFKMAMGFPMLATMVWLFSFNARRFGVGGPLRIGMALVMVAMGVWIWGQFVQRGRKARILAAFFSIALPVAALALTTVRDAEGWQKWSPEAVEKARAEGRPVLVDFTADWCANCKANKILAIDVSDVQAKLKEINAVTLVADNTDQDPAIVTELKKFERAGVPLVLVYPKDRDQQPIVLPEALTPGIVLNALDRAAR
jgi:thiol:disulfide interchange protein